MSPETPWQGRRYYPISQYFHRRFGERVAKISVSVAETCPNRSANSSMQPCVFCDEWGSAAYHLERDRGLQEQIRFNRQLVTRRLKARRFLVYFQSYTNTLDKVEVLRRRFETALAEDDVAGLVVGTRPDCLPQRLFPLLDAMSRRRYLMLEIGAQSFFDDQLQFLRRGHSAQSSVAAVFALAQKTRADIGLHLIFGMPGDSPERLIETARIVNRLPVANVKLHNLHVLSNTPLAEMHRRGEFVPDELEPYADKVILFLRHLSPTIAVQRLAAVASRWDELIAPQWTGQKMQPIDFIEKRMARAGVVQGDLYEADSRPERLFWAAG